MDRRSFLTMLGLAPAAAAVAPFAEGGWANETAKIGRVAGVLRPMGSVSGTRLISSKIAENVQQSLRLYDELHERNLRRMVANVVFKTEGKGRLHCRVKEYG